MLRSLTIALSGALGFLVALSSSPARAGVIDAPFVVDSFPSRLDLSLSLLPAWTGLPGPVPASTSLFGSPTIIHREVSPFVQAGLDTIDVEIVSMSLTGTVPTLLGLRPVEVRVGAGNGFFPGLLRSGGQVQDKAGPPDGVIQFDANSIFDVFFDIWVDLNNDTIVNVGEVLRNFSHAVHMTNFALSSLPPALDGSDPYVGNGRVLAGDPNIGMFGAVVEPQPVDLFVVFPDGSAGGRHAVALSVTHVPTPEIDGGAAVSALALLIALLALMSERARRPRQVAAA